jgi:DNA (cytosine-5)-methyltransferase 1
MPLASRGDLRRSRSRIQVLGARHSFPLPSYPVASGAVNVAQAIGDLPEAEHFPALKHQDWVRASFGRPSAYAAILRGEGLDPADFSYRRMFDPSVLTSSALTEHTALSRKRFANTEHGKTEPISRFLKLDPRGICNTLRAGTASDRGAFTSPRPIHPLSPRVITVREAARLHSYPDWFRFHVTKWHGFRQIGNSVPPLLARAVATQIMQALQLQPQKPTETLELGDTNLLSMPMDEAAAHFKVSSNVIPKRRIAVRRPRNESDMEPSAPFGAEMFPI